MRKINESDGLMQRVPALQKDPLKNKSTLMKIASGLQKYEKQIKRLKKELGSPLQPWNGKLESVGDDSQLTNTDLRNMLKIQQQNIQMSSYAAKILHDTALALIHKIG